MQQIKDFKKYTHAEKIVTITPKMQGKSNRYIKYNTLYQKIRLIMSNHSSFNTNARVILFLKACESINKFYITVRKYATPSKNPKLTLHFYCSHPC